MEQGSDNLDISPLSDVQNAIKQLATERKWEQFHTPKNLCISICVEAAELLATVQWATDEELGLDRRTQDVTRRIQEELGDVFINCLQLCNVLGINPITIITEKLAQIQTKYPPQDWQARHK